LSESTAFKIRAFLLLLNVFSGLFFVDKVLILRIVIPKIDFIANKGYCCIGDALNYLGIPLNMIKTTFLRALIKESGELTEKMMRKISVPGYAN
jgi:hypothetical protein